MSETNRARRMLWASLMEVPHRIYGPLVARLTEAMEEDPDLLSRGCVFLATGGTAIRDQANSAVIALLQAPYPEFREAGKICLLGSRVLPSEPGNVLGLPPYRIFRVDQFMRSPFRMLRGLRAEVGRFTTGREAEKNLVKIAHRLECKPEDLSVERDMMHRKSPRLMRGVMTAYLRHLEASPGRFDEVVLRNRHAIGRVYRAYHIKPGYRAQAILFDNDPPTDSKLYTLKQAAHTSDLRERMCLLVEDRIPATIASSLLPKSEPAVLVAMIELMSPTEALNARAYLEASGIFNIAEVKAAYVKKVSQASSSASRAEFRVSAQGSDQEIQEAVDQAREKAVTGHGRIERDTLLLVDRSSSMQRAIDAAKRFASRIAPLIDGEFLAVVFNDEAQEIEISPGASYKECEEAFKFVRANGMTSVEAGLSFAYSRKKFIPSQVIVITDGGENVGTYVHGLQQIEGHGLEVPDTVVIRVPGERDMMTPEILRAGYRVDKLEFAGDYNLFDQVVPLLTSPQPLTLIQRILETKLPCLV